MSEGFRSGLTKLRLLPSSCTSDGRTPVFGWTFIVIKVKFIFPHLDSNLMFTEMPEIFFLGREVHPFSCCSFSACFIVSFRKSPFGTPTKASPRVSHFIPVFFCREIRPQKAWFYISSFLGHCKGGELARTVLKGMFPKVHNQKAQNLLY